MHVLQNPDRGRAVHLRDPTLDARNTMLQDSLESLDLRRPRTESRHPSCAITEAVTQSRSSARSPKAFDAAVDGLKPQLFDFRIPTALYDYNWDQDSSRSQTYGTNRDSSDFQERAEGRPCPMTRSVPSREVPRL